MKLAIVSSRYPSENNPYNHMFVHTRSLYFNKHKDIMLTVFVPSLKDEKYEFDGIKVIKASSFTIAKIILEYDVVYLHLLNIYSNLSISGWPIYESIMKNNISTAMYIHGSEVQKYGTRSFDFNYSPKEILKFIYKDFYFIPRMRKFINSVNSRKNAIFIVPSKWMIEEAERNLSVNLNNYQIIPNGIDTELFKFHNLYHKRYKIITLRPLESLKYAVDVAINVMKYLPDEFNLDIYGKGKLQKKYQHLINKLGLNNKVRIINKFIDRKDMNKFFTNYGIGLMPTRMDAQGVTMCEMMSSGLLTVSSFSTAIPEFITDMENGILGNNENPKEIAEKILKVVNNEELYKKICMNAEKKMQSLRINITMRKELNVIKKVI